MSQFGLSEADIPVIRANARQLHADRENLGLQIVLTSFVVVVAILWPILGPLAIFAFVPGIFLGVVIEMALGKLTRPLLAARLEAIPGYIQLKEYERRQAEYEDLRFQRELEEKRQRSIAEQNKKLRDQQVRRRQKTYWCKLSPRSFEHEVAELFRQNGFIAIVTGRSGDGGVDIELTRNGETILVQCKRYREKVGPSVVRELRGVMASRNVRRGYVVCPSGFTEAAKSFAATNAIELFDIDRLLTLCESTTRGNSSWN